MRCKYGIHASTDEGRWHGARGNAEGKRGRNVDMEGENGDNVADVVVRFQLHVTGLYYFEKVAKKP